MSIVGVKNKNEKLRSRWDQAIADAKRRIKELKYSIKVYKEQRDKGEQWPEPSKRT